MPDNTKPEQSPLPNPANPPVVDSAKWTGETPIKVGELTVTSGNAGKGNSLIPPKAPVPASDVRPELYILDDVENYLKDAKVRFAGMITGMATTTAEMIRHLENAAIHLKDHIDQTTTKAEKGAK